MKTLKNSTTLEPTYQDIYCNEYNGLHLNVILHDVDLNHIHYFWSEPIKNKY